MTTTTRMQPIFEALKESGPNVSDSVARISLLAHVLDSAITIPGTNRTIGIDPLLGLIPVIGDAISAALSSYIIWEAKQLGLPSWKLARMIGNVAVDTVVGAVPFVGDFFDLGFKSNKRNVRIVLDHLEKTGRLTPKVIEGTAVRVDEFTVSPLARERALRRRAQSERSQRSEGEGLALRSASARKPSPARRFRAESASPRSGERSSARSR